MNDVNIFYHPNQLKIFQHPAKIKVIRKGRRFGLTHGMAIFISECLLTGKYTRVLWGDVTLGNTKKYWQRYFLPIWKKVDESLWAYSKQDNQFTFRNSYIDFRGADRPDNWEGFGYDIIVLNEAGIILKNEELYYNSVLPMSMEYDADMIIGGTPKGKKGIFYNLCRNKSENTKEFVFTSYDNPMIDKEKIDEMVKNMPRHVAQQEIYAEFLDDSGSVFRNVDECALSEGESPSDEYDYYMGVDLAKTYDATCIKVMRHPGIEVYTERMMDVPWAIQMERIQMIAQTYNNAQVLADATGVGDPIVEALEQTDLNITPYKFTNESKYNLIKNLALGFEKKSITIMNDETTIKELKEFEYQITNTGKIKYEGKDHDDTVIALALSYMHLSNTTQPSIRLIKRPFWK